METRDSKFLLDLATSMEEQAQRTEEAARDAYHSIVTQSSGPEFRQLLEELSLKAKEIWQTSHDAYDLIEKNCPEFDTDDLLRRRACVSLAMGEWDKAFRAFEEVSRASDASEQGWIERVVNAALNHITSPESYERTKAWIEDQRETCELTQDQLGSRRARSAMLSLVREKYWSARQDHGIQPEFVPSLNQRLLVTPIIIEADAKLFPREPGWDKAHPLFQQYLPSMRERIKRETGVSVPPGIRFQASESLPPNSYIISINEVPLVLGEVEPERMFCPNHSEASFILGLPGDDLKRTFNPSTGDQNGAWIEKSHWADFQTSTAPLWDRFEYMVYHLEHVLRSNLSSFLGMQEMHDLLERWAKDSGDDEARRRNLINEALPDVRSRVRFMQVLQGLVKEAVPITNLSNILESFRQQNVKNKEVISLIEAARIAIKDELAGNDGLFELFYLSPAFEEEVRRWLFNFDGRLFFAIPPDETQALLEAFRSAVKGEEQSRLAVVTRGEGIRLFVRRLIELEFPRVTVLCARELNPRLRDKVFGTVEFQPVVKTNP